MAAAEGPEARPAGSAQLYERYCATRAATLALADPLSEEDCGLQSMPDASPVKWHLAHTTWFFETFVLERFDAAHRAWDPAYRVLFNSYYNSVGEQYPRPQRGLISRPSMHEVRRYRAFVDERIALLFASDEGGGAAPEFARIVEVGIAHEQQHQELILTDVKHALWHTPDLPAYLPQAATGGDGGGRETHRRDGLGSATTRGAWFEADEGLRRIGVDVEGDGGFAFDNEGPRHRVFLESFALAMQPVTNAEWRAFIADDGYHRPELWLSDGWALCQRERWEAPLYWCLPGGVRPSGPAVASPPAVSDAGGWEQFTLSGCRPLCDDEPVCHVSYYEAEAFAAWAGARLPREAEWEWVAAQLALDDERAAGCFVDSGRLHPRPLDRAAPVGSAAPAEGRPTGPPGDGTGSLPRDLFGNVWEWTASPYTAYPRYRAAAGALGEYNGKFMADQWVLRGGSCATPAVHIRPTYRNFFPAPARWQFSGLRLARDLGSPRDSRRDGAGKTLSAACGQ